MTDNHKGCPYIWEEDFHPALVLGVDWFVCCNVGTGFIPVRMFEEKRTTIKVVPTFGKRISIRHWFLELIGSFVAM
ncbi:MAG: hypothetical protein WCT39_02695 [Candidatus Margulisiibacteriota bacterium]